MRKELFKNCTEMSDFTKICLRGELQKGDIIATHWRKAKDFREFCGLLLSDEQLNECQGYWELAKEACGKYYKYSYRKLLHLFLQSKADVHFETLSDSGSLKIGTKDFTYDIPNGSGDGSNHVYIIENRVDIPIPFITACNGEFNIYDYDCGDRIAKTLQGRYAIYATKRLFVFEKWE